jgi:hypothetical protein
MPVPRFELLGPVGGNAGVQVADKNPKHTAASKR